MDEPTQNGCGRTEAESGPPALALWLRGLLTAIILAGLAFRVFWLADSVFCEDQARACALAEDIAHGRWERAGLVNSGDFRNLPGFVYLLAGVWLIWPSPMGLLYFTAGVNIAAVLLAAWLMKRWKGSAAAWWGTAFLAAAPWAIHYSRWIWAQHLLFPAALLVYLFVWRWICCGSRWAALGVIVSLTLVVQIHLAGVALVLAVAALVAWCRPKLTTAPVGVGLAIAVASVLPYLLTGHLDAPGGNRLGHSHFWRAAPAAAMSVTGVGWSLEFRGGYPAFARSVAWRRWPYEIVMTVPILLLAAGAIFGIRRLWQARRNKASRRSPPAITGALVVLIPLSFAAMGIRTSPTYFPLWYPLPFALMGWAAVRMQAKPGGGKRRWLAPLLLVVLIVELSFFVEQLRYIHANRGVPGSPLGRCYAAMKGDVKGAVRQMAGDEVYLDYDGHSPIQEEAAAYLFRHSDWPQTGSAPRVLTHFTWGRADEPCTVQTSPLGDGKPLPEAAYRVHPWLAAQQADGRIPRQARSDTAR